MTTLMLGKRRGPHVLSQFSKFTSHNCVRARSISIEALHEQLTTRRLPLTYDYLSPQPSHLLDLTLRDILRTEFASNIQDPLTSNDLPSILQPSRMPPGHHLVYFPPQVSLSQLLADGTDVLHTPGSPFTRRLWAGGAVRFPCDTGPLLNCQRAVCVESIRDVSIKGATGEEKIRIGIEKHIFEVEENEDEQSIKNRAANSTHDDSFIPHVIEKRNLVFLRDAKMDSKSTVAQMSPSRYIKPPLQPLYSCRLIPSESLLFRFSALTFNAHSIHLDKLYATQKEGYQDLLVHGPLTLTLMLTVFRQYTANMGISIRGIDYRNLAPLMVGEEMTICVKPKTAEAERQWDIWIEGPKGGLAVRGVIDTY